MNAPGRKLSLPLPAVERFEQRVTVTDIAAELRVTEQSVRRWRQAWEAAGVPGVASKGPATRCRLGGDQLAELDRVLDA